MFFSSAVFYVFLNGKGKINPVDWRAVAPLFISSPPQFLDINFT
jgi:hypothetical protein